MQQYISTVHTYGIELSLTPVIQLESACETGMTPAQMNFLTSIADKIPRLFKSIAEGNMHAEYQLGSRMLNGRQVKLSLVAEVCDPGDNPLSTHSKPMPVPVPISDNEPDTVSHTYSNTKNTA